MQKLRPIKLLDVVQGIDQHIDIVAVNRADVIETEFFKHGRGRDHALGVFLHAFGDFLESGRVLQHFFGGLFGVGVKTPGQQFCEVIVERTDRFRNRHVVVVQNDDDIFAADIVHRFKRHARRDGTIADDGNRLPLDAGDSRRHRHAECG